MRASNTKLKTVNNRLLDHRVLLNLPFDFLCQVEIGWGTGETLGETHFLRQSLGETIFSLGEPRRK